MPSHRRLDSHQSESLTLLPRFNCELHKSNVVTGYFKGQLKRQQPESHVLNVEKQFSIYRRLRSGTGWTHLSIKFGVHQQIRIQWNSADECIWTREPRTTKYCYRLRLRHYHCRSNVELANSVIEDLERFQVEARPRGTRN